MNNIKRYTFKDTNLLNESLEEGESSEGEFVKWEDVKEFVQYFHNVEENLRHEVDMYIMSLNSRFITPSEVFKQVRHYFSFKYRYHPIIKDNYFISEPYLRNRLCK